MARKRKNLFDLRKLEPETKEYWEEVLRRDGLTVEAGRSNRLTYVGSTKDLSFVSDMSQNETGKTK